MLVKENFFSLRVIIFILGVVMILFNFSIWFRDMEGIIDDFVIDIDFGGMWDIFFLGFFFNGLFWWKGCFFVFVGWIKFFMKCMCKIF